MSVHIGNKIKEIFTERGMSVSEFGRRIKMSRENVYSIFRRKTIDTGLLEQISQVLEHDFFQYYTPLKEEIEKLREENNLLRELTTLRENQKNK